MMMRNGNKVLVIGLVLLAGFASSASAVTKGMKKVVEDALDFSVRQSMSMFGEMKDQKGILPRTAKDGEMITCDSGWWTSGFYPGTLWYCYEYSNDPQVRAAAEEMTSRVESRSIRPAITMLALSSIAVSAMATALPVMKLTGK